MVAANSVKARLENSRVIPRIIPSSASVNGRPQNARPSPIVTGIASDLLHAGSHAYVTGIFRESPENSSPRTSRMYKLQGQASRPVPVERPFRLPCPPFLGAFFLRLRPYPYNLGCSARISSACARALLI